MELIKQIKNAEAQSKQIIEQAKVESAKMVAEATANRSEQFEKASQRRNETIKKAVSQAETEGLAEAEQLKAQAEQALKKLRNNAAQKSGAAVAKIVEAIKALGD